MKAAAAIPLVLLIGLLGWLLLGRRAPEPVSPYDAGDRTSPGSAAPAPLEVATSGGLASVPARPVGAPDRAPASSLILYGSAIVTLVPPDGTSMPAGFSLDASPVGFTHHLKYLGLEREDRTWAYAELPVGKWRFRAFVPGCRDVAEVVEVRRDAEAAVRIQLEVGGAASWKVRLTTLEAPELVRVLLLDGRGVAIDGTYQTAATTLHVAPADVPALPSDGRVVGLTPGRYRLRASTLDGPTKEEAFEVKAGEIVPLEFTFSR